MDGSEIADRVVGAGKIETGNAESEIADIVVGVVAAASNRGGVIPNTMVGATRR